eukprot:5588728-Pyramimonas_sp.AAC.1
MDFASMASSIGLMAAASVSSLLHRRLYSSAFWLCCSISMRPSVMESPKTGSHCSASTCDAIHCSGTSVGAPSAAPASALDRA